MLWALICYAIDFLVGKAAEEKNERGLDPY